MRHAETGRLIAQFASACLLLVLSCGLLGVAVQQRVITPRDIHVQFGPLLIITRGPSSFNCPPQSNPHENLCDRMRLAPLPPVYRMWLYWDLPGHGTESTRAIAQWALPVRQ